MMKKDRIIGLIVILVSLGLGYQIVNTWRGAVLTLKGYSRESLLKAAQLDPMNPDVFYKLGLLHQLDLMRIDVKESNRYLQMAIRKNPLNQEYWFNLAKVLFKNGNKGAGNLALQKAIMVYPTSYPGRWIAGVLLLQQGSLEAALPHFSYILTHYPNQSRLVYEIWGTVANDLDFILERLIPRDPTSLDQYLNYLYEVRDKKLAARVWNLKASLEQKVNRSQALRHIEFLISQGEIHEAFKTWRAELQEEGLSDLANNDSVTDGGFEFEKKVLDGGFEWRISPVAGAEISFDHTVFFEGKGALKLRFTGKENVNFQNVWQYVPLKPKTNYLLQAQVKTRGVTTKSGIKLEITGIGPRFQGVSEGLTGDNDWTKVIIPFQTPAGLQGGILRVKRDSTNKFDRFISGEVWIDNVQLIEKGSSGDSGTNLLRR